MFTWRKVRIQIVLFYAFFFALFVGFVVFAVFAGEDFFFVDFCTFLAYLSIRESKNLSDWLARASLRLWSASARLFAAAFSSFSIFSILSRRSASSASLAQLWILQPPWYPKNKTNLNNRFRVAIEEKTLKAAAPQSSNPILVVINRSSRRRSMSH